MLKLKKTFHYTISLIFCVSLVPTEKIPRNYITNELLFNLSLPTHNFKLFDNNSFGVSHLSGDGIHLNNAGKVMLSRCWVDCVLIRLGFLRESLPLRPGFARRAGLDTRPRRDSRGRG